MAISRMEKLSLILPGEELDAVLLTLQDFGGLEFHILPEKENWQAAFAQQTLQLPVITHYDGKKQLTLEGEEALHYLDRRQQRLEQAIAQLQACLPKQGLWASLRQERRSLPMDAVQTEGKRLDETALLEKVRRRFKDLAQIRQQLQAIQEEERELSVWKNLEISPRKLAEFRHIKALIGTVPSSSDDAAYKALRQAADIEVQEVYHTETEYGLILFRHPPAEEGAETDLEASGFKPLVYDHDNLPRERLAQLAAEQKALQKEQEQIEEELRTSQAVLEDLELASEYLLNLYARQAAKKKLAASQHVTAIEGWIEEDRIQQLTSRLIREFGDAVLIETGAVNETDWADVPIRLKNHPWIEPFEIVTEMYALPKYYESDPTPILMPFYLTFFGMMVADLGYGLLMLLGTLTALRSFKLSKGSSRFMRFFAILGVSVSLWGLVYGSFFGYTLPVQLISTTDDVMTILLLSIAFGFVTVVVGLILGGRQQVRLKQYAAAYTDGFAWCLILTGLLLLALGTALPSLSLLAGIGQWLAIINAVGILLVSVFKAKSLSGLGSGLYNLYNVSGYIGDLVSFTRLMALGLSGASIASAFNLIVDLFPGISKFLVGSLLFILLHAINIFLGLLSGYVHGARLMFVEFFGKFYEGGGRPFDPLRPAEKHLTIRNDVHLEDN